MDYKQRKNKMIEMRDKGAILQKIADKYGISRERVRQIVNNIKIKKIQKIKIIKTIKDNIEERKLIIYPLLEKVGKEQIQKVLQGLVNYNQQLRPIENYFKNITKETGMNGGSRERHRELIRKRDNYRCQLCGFKQFRGIKKIFPKYKRRSIKSKRRLDVHHIYDENGENSIKSDKEFNKQITLCHQCHLQVDSWKINKGA